MDNSGNFAIGKDPLNRDMKVPVKVDDATDIYLKLKTDQDIKNYFQENGYVIIRNVVPADLCDQARDAFLKEVKPYHGFIYRQASANPEKHKITPHGYMLNSILNIQSIKTDPFPTFKKLGLEVITHKNVTEKLRALMGELPKVVQSMYFEGNPATWAHQDSYYLDSEKFNMIASWFAVEDIAPGAGRFYVYPGSHKIDMEKNGGDFDIAFNHDRYKELIKKIIIEKNLQIVAPSLRKGDIFLWHGKTIHGSLDTFQPEYSRSSFTAHYIPQSERFLQFQSIIKPIHTKKINGIEVNHPKDLDAFKNRAIMFAETTFPKSFQFLKKVAIKAMVK